MARTDLRRKKRKRINHSAEEEEESPTEKKVKLCEDNHTDGCSSCMFQVQNITHKALVALQEAIDSSQHPGTKALLMERKRKLFDRVGKFLRRQAQFFSPSCIDG